MKVKKITIAVMAVVVVLILLTVGVIYNFHNPIMKKQTTKIDVPSRLTYWVEQNLGNFSNEEWLLSMGYNSVYNNDQELDAYVCAYNYEPTLQGVAESLTRSSLTGIIRGYNDFKTDIAITSQGECTRTIPQSISYLIYKEEYLQATSWIYRYVFSQEAGASIEIVMVITKQPAEKHEEQIEQLITELYERIPQEIVPPANEDQMTPPRYYAYL